MSTIKDFFGNGSDLSEIKGTGWDTDDTLKIINDKTDEIKNTTKVIRADTGELNGTAILDLYVTNDLALTGNITVKNLYVSDGAHITGNYTIVVTGKCSVYSSSIVIKSLDIRGDLYTKFIPGSTTTSTITLSDLYVLGKADLNDIVMTIANTTYIVGELNIDNFNGNFGTLITENNIVMSNLSCDGTIYTIGNINISSGDNISCNIYTNESLTVDANQLSGDKYINGNFTCTISDKIFNYSNFYIYENADITCPTFNQDNINDIFEVNGDCLFHSAITCTHINNWIIHGTLTLPDLDCNGQISIHTNNFIYNGTTLYSASNTNNVRSGGGGNGSGGTNNNGGLCPWLDLIVIDTLTAPNLTSIKAIAGNGVNGGSYYWENTNYHITEWVLGGGSAGGSVHGNIYILNAQFDNTVNIIFTPGNGSVGSSHGEYYGGNGAHGVINSNGLAGSNANYDHTHNAGGGGGSAGFVGGAGGNGYAYYYNSMHANGGNGPNFDATGNILIINELNKTHTESITYGTIDTNTKNISQIFNYNYDNLYPKVPILITENNALNPTTLEFTIPTFPNDINLDFEIQIERQLTEKINNLIINENTNDNPNDFSGTAPYLQGSGNISFTLPELEQDCTYRWKVKCMKDSDTSIASIYSDWRYFTISS